MVAGIVISVVLILLMVFNAPIINFKKLTEIPLPHSRSPL